MQRVTCSRNAGFPVPSLLYPPMYPMVSGSTLSVHGDKLVTSPAPRTMTYVKGVTPAQL